MTFWEFWMEKYQCQAQSTEETGKCCKNSEIIKGREILAMFLWLLFTAQESCDLCIAASSQQAAEPDHRPVMAPEMSSGVTGPHKDSKTDSFLQWGFPQEFLFWCHRLHQCLLIHINLKKFIRTFSHIILIRQKHQVNLYHSLKIFPIFLFACLLPLSWLSEALASVTCNLGKISLQAWRSLWIWILKSIGSKCLVVYTLKPSKHTTATKEVSGKKAPRITSYSDTQEIIFTMMNIGVHICFPCSLFDFFLIKTQKWNWGNIY